MVGFFIILIAVVLGIFTGLNIEISSLFVRYISVAIIACLDASLGSILASIKKEFKFSEFLVRFFGNAIISILLVYLGDKLEIDIYLGAVIFFTAKILENISKIRKVAMDKYNRLKHKKISE